MTVKVRQFRPEDRDQVHKLVADGLLGLRGAMLRALWRKPGFLLLVAPLSALAWAALGWRAGLAALAAAGALPLYLLRKEMHDYVYVQSLRGDLADIPAFYLQPGSNFWVAELDGKVVGCVGLESKGASTAELRRMSVDARLRGRGVGAQLLQALIAFARREGYTKVVLGTSEVQRPAMRLYERHGFKRVKWFPIMALPRWLGRLPLMHAVEYVLDLTLAKGEGQRCR